MTKSVRLSLLIESTSPFDSIFFCKKSAKKVRKPRQESTRLLPISNARSQAAGSSGFSFLLFSFSFHHSPTPLSSPIPFPFLFGSSLPPSPSPPPPPLVQRRPGQAAANPTARWDRPVDWPAPAIHRSIGLQVCATGRGRGRAAAVEIHRSIHRIG